MQLKSFRIMHDWDIGMVETVCLMATLLTWSLRHKQYFVDPLPPSILWTRWCCAKSDKVLNSLDLSTLSNVFSKSVRLNVS